MVIDVADCPFVEGWKNQEGWFVQDNGRLVCADFDDYCAICRKDDSKDFFFDIAEEYLDQKGVENSKEV